jgi:hypothetical protein
MAITRVTSVRPLPGKLDAFLGRLAEAKKILEGHGSSVTFYRTHAGPDPNAVLVVASVDDWAQFAEVSAKVQADAAWQAFERQQADDPAAERLGSSIIQDFTLP